MRRFECKVTRVDVYVVEIEEDKLDKNLIPEFEECIHKLNDKDKVKDLVRVIGRNVMNNDSDHYEGLGYIMTDNLTFRDKDELVQGISITTDETEDYDVEITEL